MRARSIARPGPVMPVHPDRRTHPGRGRGKARIAATFAALAALTLAGCSRSSGAALTGMTPARHAAFPIGSGDHALDCATCHTTANTFAEFSCTGCHTHDQVPTDLLHRSVPGYASTSADCYRCHAAPAGPATFSHTGITGSCAVCHAAGASFGALPRANFTHADVGGADCGECHTTTSWSAGTAPTALVHDAARSLTLTALVPSYAGTSIVKVTPLSETLPMSMNHGSAALPTAVLDSCATCHVDASTGVFFPGVMHSSLANQRLSQPGTCADCHADAAPTGLVGPTATHPARTPASGEMKHDAVAWAAGAPTSTRLVTADCAACHAPPAEAIAATWATAASGAGRPAYHASLGAAQPPSCVDCHANSRPAVITSATAALPAGVSFDHGAALDDCAACHAVSAAIATAGWAGGKFHQAGDANPASCLPCHAGERPTSATGWRSATYAASPFDYGTNAAGITHGDGLDCATCHAGPGTGAWGGTQNWVGGQFSHAAGTVASSTCVACHMSQRPDLQPGATAASAAALLGFDHFTNGSGDCFGCHQATVAAGRYVHYVDPATGKLPNGDWKGGYYYPGATLASAADQLVSLSQITLVRSGALITGMTSSTATLYNSMAHLSATIPAAMAPGPSGDQSTCWHCHAHTAGTVTSYVNARFHTALTTFQATPGGAVTPFPQPTTCNDCHGAMRPPGIVEGGGSDLRPMDHSALFVSPVTIGGLTARGVADLDCAACHQQTGQSWADGVFHARIGSAVPADCAQCHYPLMADAPKADVASGSLYQMSHRSALVTVQRCDACHAGALAQATSTPAAALWQNGAYHGSVSSQPGACMDCHSTTDPTSPTQSTVTYALAQGGTSTNAGQWMSHRGAGVAGQDCVKCHAADARASGAAWSRSTAFHAAVASPGSCQACHGVTNGNGATIGTGNNLPTGLTDSTTLTSASNDATTGVPAGTHAQLTHADVNVTGHDCGFCHTQRGPSTAAGIRGKEWAQASFHARFSAAAPLRLDGSAGRCSNCHMNVKPGTSFTSFDHSALSAVAGTQDCSACHSWPGTGTATAPSWLGAAGAPQLIAVGGFTIPRPPAANTTTTQTGIASLPHPGTATIACSACHAGGAGGKNAIGYDHASSLAASSCNACHEAGSNLVGTAWNGAAAQSAGAGDTRPYTITSLTAWRGTKTGDACTVTYPNHFYPVDCKECHSAPPSTGTGAVTTGAAYTSAWIFPHTQSKMSNPSTCNMCHDATCSK